MSAHGSRRTGPHRYHLQICDPTGGHAFSGPILYVRATFTEWHFLKSAYSDGKRLQFAVVDRSVPDGYRVHEDFYLGLTVDPHPIGAPTIRDLARGPAPFEFVVEGLRGDLTVSVPAGYFAGFLAALVDQARSD